MKTNICRLLVSASIFGLCMSFSPGVFAADKVWRGDLYHEDEPGGDGPFDFFEGGNWYETGAPTAGDVVIFSGSGDYAIPADSEFTVRLTTDTPDLNRIEWRDGPFELTFDLNENELTAGGGMSLLGSSVGDGIVVNLTGGDASFLHFSIADAANEVGTLYIDGEGTSVETTNTDASYDYIGRRGTGIFHVDNKAHYTDSLRTMVHVGQNQGSHGTLKFTNNATALFQNHLNIGFEGSGALYVESDAQVTVTPFGGNRFVSFARSGSSDQTVTGLITGEDSVFEMTGVTNTDRGIGIGGAGDRTSDHQSEGSAHVTVEKGGRMGTNMLIVLWEAGKLTVDNGTVAAGTDFEAYDGSEVELVLHNANRDALIQVGGNVLIEENVTLTLSLAEDASFTAYQDFVKLIEYGDSLTDVGVFADFTEGQTFSLAAPGGDSFVFQFTYAYEDGDDTFVGLHVIPEPGAAGLLLLGGLALAARRRLLRG